MLYRQRGTKIYPPETV
ncbi:hypothetical protein ACT4UL_00880 [Bacillus sp. HC-TM]